MDKIIFINLSVSDLERSAQFYAAMGFVPYALYTGGDQRCMTWGSHVYVMLQSAAMFHAHIRKQMPGLGNYQSASYTLPLSSPSEVDRIMQSALDAGGKEPIPMIDEGYMQVRTIEDPDGHVWAVMFLDIKRFEQERN